jgi:hypothetical protein
MSRIEALAASGLGGGGSSRDGEDGIYGEDLMGFTRKRRRRRRARRALAREQQLRRREELLARRRAAMAGRRRPAQRGPSPVEQAIAQRRAFAGKVVTQRREVVGEGVDPDVDRVPLVAGHGDAPLDGGARDGKVAQLTAHERDHLVLPGFGADEVFPLLVERQETVAVGRQSEKVVLLLDQLDRLAVNGAELLARLGALARHQLVFILPIFAADAVEPFVVGGVDVPAGLHPFPHLTDRGQMVGVGGADEAIVADADPAPGALECGGHLVAVNVERLALLGGHPFDLLSVLVDARQEEGVSTLRLRVPRTPVAGERVGDHRRVERAQVGEGVDVIDGGGDVKRRVAHRGPSTYQPGPEVSTSGSPCGAGGLRSSAA